MRSLLYTEAIYKTPNPATPEQHIEVGPCHAISASQYGTKQGPQGPGGLGGYQGGVGREAQPTGMAFHHSRWCENWGWWFVRASCRTCANPSSGLSSPNIPQHPLAPDSTGEIVRGSLLGCSIKHPPRGCQRLTLGSKGPRRVGTAMVRQAEVRRAGAGRPRRITRRVEVLLRCHAHRASNCLASNPDMLDRVVKIRDGGKSGKRIW